MTDSDVAEGDPGPVERQVRADIAEMGELTGTRRSTAAICYALARYLDDLMGKPGTGGPGPVAARLHDLMAELEQTSTGREASDADRIAAGIADELAPRRDMRAHLQVGAEAR